MCHMGKTFGDSCKVSCMDDADGDSFLLSSSQTDFNPREFSSFRHAKWGSMSVDDFKISSQTSRSEATEDFLDTNTLNSMWQRRHCFMISINFEAILMMPTLRTAAFGNSFNIPHFSSLTPKNFSVEFLKPKNKGKKR